MKNAEQTEKDSTRTLETNRRELTEHQAKLEVEEAELEKIQESLRGKISLHLNVMFHRAHLSGKAKPKGSMTKYRRSRKSFNHGQAKSMPRRLLLKFEKVNARPSRTELISVERL